MGLLKAIDNGHARIAHHLKRINRDVYAGILLTRIKLRPVIPESNGLPADLYLA